MRDGYWALKRALWTWIRSDLSVTFSPLTHSQRFSPESLLALLSHKNTRLHEQSESLANAFVEGLPFEVAEVSILEVSTSFSVLLKQWSYVYTLPLFPIFPQQSHPPSLSPSPGSSSPSPYQQSSTDSPSTNSVSLPSSASQNGIPVSQDPSLTFVRRYRAMRTNYHRRNLVGERMANGSVTWREWDLKHLSSHKFLSRSLNESRKRCK